MQAELLNKPERKTATARPATSRVDRQVDTDHPSSSALPLFVRGGEQRKAVLQPKLTINSSGDIYEQEADRVAEQVMRMPQPEPAASVAGATAGLQRKCECGGTCAECQAEEQDERAPRLQMKSAAPGGTGLTTAPPIVNEVLSSPGQPLGGAERAFMEPRFGQDFSGVRVHTDTRAAESAAAVQARAYTVGDNIVLGGKESASDLPVLAHELAHVVQQSGTSPALQRLEYCTDFLEMYRRPGVGEHSVRDSLAGDAAHFGPVETELLIDTGSATPWRTDPPRGRSDTVIFPQNIGGVTAGEGKADVALLQGSTLEIIEVKEATWDGGLFAEWQLRNYLEKAEDRPDLVDASWRAQRHPEEITSVKAMPMTRLNLQPNPRVLQGRPVSLRWCRDGIVVFKVKDEEEQEEEQKEKEQKQKEKESGPSATLPEQLLKFGGEVLLLLAADGLLSLAMSLAAALAPALLSPLVALAALILAIAFFLDKFEWLAGKIADLIGWVVGKITWILGKIAWLGIKLGELISWLGGKIAWLVKKLAAGIKWVAGEIAAGAKWLGHKIASAARSVWDWIWGSDVEATAAVVDLPVTETTTRCAMVAHEDAIVNLGADLLFETNEWKLKPEADTPLKEAARKVVSMHQGDDKVTFAGFTDNRGTAEYNQDLSEKRAKAVADWFVQNGVIPMSIVQTEGFGKTQAQYNDPEGRKKDRRVEIWVPKHGSVEQMCW